MLNTRIQQKIDSLSNWTSSNPVLLKNEVALSNDNNLLNVKIGNGIDHYNDLPFSTLPTTGGNIVRINLAATTKAETYDLIANNYQSNFVTGYYFDSHELEDSLDSRLNGYWHFQGRFISNINHSFIFSKTNYVNAANVTSTESGLCVISETGINFYRNSQNLKTVNF